MVLTLKPRSPAVDSELSRLGRVDGYLKVSGHAVYTGDLQRPDMLYGEVVRSPYAHARIVKVDTAAAAAVPGVHAVLTGADIAYGLYGRSVQDTPALAGEVVRYIGERVAAVAAESPEIARDAAALIAVEYEPLPAVLDYEQALQDEATPVHAEPWSYKNAVVTAGEHPNLQSRKVWSGGSDVETALAASHRVFAHTFRTQSRHQAYLEPHVCVAQITEAGIEIWAANKAPYKLRAHLAAWTGTPKEKVHVHPVLIGGDFGGKGDFGDIPLCVVLAQRTGRPVRMRMRYVEDLMAGNPRHPATIQIRMGVDRQSRMTALDVKALLDGGAYAGYKPLASVNLSGMSEAAGSYRIPAARVESLIAYTHTVPRGHMRSPGSVQSVFAMECMVDIVARELGIDPVEFRRSNMLQQGDTAALGEHWLEIRSNEVMDAAIAALEQAPPLSPSPPGAPPGGDWAIGTGVGLYNRHTHPSEMEVALQPQPDGTLEVLVGFPDQGGGQFTMARNIVCQELSLPAGLVRVRQADTDGLTTDAGTGGSWVTVTGSETLTRACAKLKLRVHEVLGAHIGGSVGAEEHGSDARAVLEAFAAATGTERITAYLNYKEHDHVTSFCVQTARVWVDRSSGQVVVAEIISAMDVATIVNPASHMAQIEGGVVTGYGDAVLEDLTIEDGKVTAANLGDYKLPSIRDLPSMPIILIEGSKGIGQQNVKGIGELTNVAVVPAVANAVAAAVGVRIDSLPITAEKVYFALQTKGAGQ